MQGLEFEKSLTLCWKCTLDHSRAQQVRKKKSKRIQSPITVCNACTSVFNTHWLLLQLTHQQWSIHCETWHRHICDFLCILAWVQHIILLLEPIPAGRPVPYFMSAEFCLHIHFCPWRVTQDPTRNLSPGHWRSSTGVEMNEAVLCRFPSCLGRA